MLLHAPWGGREVIAGSRVLDAFAGSGALGLEALSRGADHATFMDTDARALAALSANVTALGAARRAAILRANALHPPVGSPTKLIFLDPPYALGLTGPALAALRQAGWVADKALLVTEVGRAEPVPMLGEFLAERVHGAARLVVCRVSGGAQPDLRVGCPGPSAASSPAQK